MVFSPLAVKTYLYLEIASKEIGLNRSGGGAGIAIRSVISGCVARTAAATGDARAIQKL